MESVHHAPFNAALLHAVALAYPETPLTFQGFSRHVEIVRATLARHDTGAAGRIAWETFETAGGSGIVARWLHGRTLIRGALRTRERLLFCSISRMQLLLLKQAMRRGDVARAVLHGDLDQIERPPQERFPASLFSLRRVLLRPSPPGLRLILPGPSIHASLPEEFRAAFSNAGVIDHPYHFPAEEPPAWRAGDPLVFGVFGNTGDGRLLEEVAGALQETAANAEIRLVGFLSGAEAMARLAPLVSDVTAEPIARGIFEERARALTHALWLAAPRGFRLRASGTFFDALAFLKPLVYTANPYIDSYFAEAPEIGLRCERVSDVPEAILTLLRTTTPERYAGMRTAMLRLRERFTPQALALRLPEQLQW